MPRKGAFEYLRGERGIRTPGPVTVNGFQDRRIRPLCHLSAAKIHSNFEPSKSFQEKLCCFCCMFTETLIHTGFSHSGLADYYRKKCPKKIKYHLYNRKQKIRYDFFLKTPRSLKATQTGEDVTRTLSLVVLITSENAMILQAPIDVACPTFFHAPSTIASTSSASIR